ncbi:inositol polyphosphate 1-phosphatase isoform X2 [Engystomops pustulosus]|uniref:inositol polyphosphate 1-phosphatase isoform X2 n=1 Tax=Engystomops pustulosus TaxID=76066 RepID=UPI003AFA1F93
MSWFRRSLNMTLEKRYRAFPGLEKNVRGEESNEFTNEHEEKIIVEVCSTEEETASLLQKVLDNNKAAAKTLARAVHQEVTLKDLALDADNVSIPLDNIAVWVDPIDSTYQYIKGSEDIKPVKGIYPKGLQCVTVLIGVFLLDTGHPIMGVINQPFAVKDPVTLRWKSQLYWGVSYMGSNICSGNPDNKTRCVSQQSSTTGDNSYAAVTSSAETKDVLKALLVVCGENLHFAAGAGYKCLCVIQGLVDFYLFSEDTTFKWDSCAPHAILKSLGGGILNLSECIKSANKKPCNRPHILYNSEEEEAKGADRWANKGGLVAYRSEQHLEDFIDIFTKNLP